MISIRIDMPLVAVLRTMAPFSYTGTAHMHVTHAAHMGARWTILNSTPTHAALFVSVLPASNEARQPALVMQGRLGPRRHADTGHGRDSFFF